MQTIRSVVNAYTDLYAAQERLKVIQQSRDLAKRTVDDNKKRIAIGKSAQSDTLRAEANYARRNEQALSAERNVLINMNRLKFLLADHHDDFFALQIKIKPLTPAQVFKADITSDYQNALKKRPDYQSAKLGVTSRDYRYQRAKQQNLPQVDLVLGHDQYGGVNRRDFSAAFDNRIGDSTYIGLEFSMPLTNRSLKAREKVAKIELEREELELKRFEQNILVGLDNAIVNAKFNLQRIAAADKSLQLAQETLAAEEKKFKVGRSQVYFVLESQQDLAAAESQKVQVTSDYYKSLIDYEFAKGSLLDFYQIKM